MPAWAREEFPAAENRAALLDRHDVHGADEALRRADEAEWERLGPLQRAAAVVAEVCRRHAPYAQRSKALDELVEARADLWRRRVLLWPSGVEGRKRDAALSGELRVTNGMIAAAERELGIVGEREAARAAWRAADDEAWLSARRAELERSRQRSGILEVGRG